jgi:pimeloyl-ACP methyl ester carboxylesterase
VTPRDPARARSPDHEGFVKRAGVRTAYEVFGHGDPTFLLLPPWCIVHSRTWKMQVPYLSRHARVVTCDPRGNGRSDRPADPAAYAESEYAADALAVLDATGTERAIVVSFSASAQRALLLAAEHPERVERLVLIAPAVPFGPRPSGPRTAALTDLRGFLEWFFAGVFSEPHSAKHIEDGVGWGLETTAEVLIASDRAPAMDEAEIRALAARVRCPALVLHGTADRIRSPGSAVALAEALGADLVLLEGSGHAPLARDPVRVNLLLRELIRRRAACTVNH